MKYQCKVTINENIEPVVNIFMNHDLMPKWHPGLKRLEKVQENPTVYHLVFESEGKEYIMKETIKEANLPRSITTIYEVPGVYNECKNTFVKKGEGVEWVMDVLFKFEQPTSYSIDDFQCKTQSGMQLFKEFIENQRY